MRRVVRSGTVERVVPRRLDAEEWCRAFGPLSNAALPSTTSLEMRRVFAAAVLVLIVAGGGYLYYSATTPYRTLPPVQINALQSGAALRKVDALRNPGLETGKNQATAVTESFSDSELSSLANQELQSRSLPIEKLVVHATGNGTIEGQATARWAGQALPIFLIATIHVVGGSRLQVTIVESKLGRVTMPQTLSDEIETVLTEHLNLSQALRLDPLTITVTEGVVTVRGMAKPA